MLQYGERFQYVAKSVNDPLSWTKKFVLSLFTCGDKHTDHTVVLAWANIALDGLGSFLICAMGCDWRTLCDNLHIQYKINTLELNKGGNSVICLGWWKISRKARTGIQKVKTVPGVKGSMKEELACASTCEYDHARTYESLTWREELF